MKDLVSIITPAYNAEKYIGKAIESVLGQSYDNWEMIIVDDCSTDSTAAIVKDYQEKDSRILFLAQPKNGGAAKARNAGLKQAKGKYIAFLDSDDMWKEDKLAHHIEFMEREKCPFSYSNYEVVDEDGNPLNKLIKAPQKVDYNRLLYGNPMGCLTVVINREVVGEFYMPSIGHEDYATWLGILKKGHQACNVNESLAYYRKAGSSLSSNKFRAIKWTWKIYREDQKLGLVKSIVALLGYGVNAITKHI